MPIKVPNSLPAKEVLKNENIFVMDEDRAFHQDIRPLRIAILNLMPTKEITEAQLLRLLGNSSLQVEVVLLHPKSYQSKNTSSEHLLAFYNTFDEVRERRFDGLIITGAPVEKLAYEEVEYWKELCDIMEWSKSNVTSTLHICWGAQAGLYYHYGIQKYELADKVFGVFSHSIHEKHNPLLRGFDDEFFVPHSRYTEVRRKDIIDCPQLVLLADSEEAGVYLVASKDGKHVFATGHSEYDPLTLLGEYKRDVNKGIPIHIPKNYFPQDNPLSKPIVKWRGHSNLLFSNWLNYFVYQETPYFLD